VGATPAESGLVGCRGVTAARGDPRRRASIHALSPRPTTAAGPNSNPPVFCTEKTVASFDSISLFGAS